MSRWSIEDLKIDDVILSTIKRAFVEDQAISKIIT